MFSNLAGNAFKFTEAGARSRFGSRLLDTRVEFFVKDTGIRDLRRGSPRVFERFRRGSLTTHPGAGLGLFIARTLVEAQGGAIEARSEVGVGSQLSFTLPRARDPGTRPDELLSGAPAPRPLGKGGVTAYQVKCGWSHPRIGVASEPWRRGRY